MLDKNEKHKVVERNLKQVENIYHRIDRLADKHYPDLIKHNIPRLCNKFPQLERREFYEIFVNFKTLIKMSIALSKSGKNIDKGLDLDAFYTGLQHLNPIDMQTAENLFENLLSIYDNRMTIDDYFKGMITLRSKNIADKIDLFINVKC